MGVFDDGCFRLVGEDAPAIVSDTQLAANVSLPLNTLTFATSTAAIPANSASARVSFLGPTRRYFGVMLIGVTPSRPFRWRIESRAAYNSGGLF